MLNQNKIKLSRKDIASFLREIAESCNDKGKEYIIKKTFGKHVYEIDLILQNIRDDKARILDIGGGAWYESAVH